MFGVIEISLVAKVIATFIPHHVQAETTPFDPPFVGTQTPLLIPQTCAYLPLSLSDEIHSFIPFFPRVRTPPRPPL
jgi:hypothetical protein